MSQFVEQGHLGGYVPGGDEATYYPELWTWLVEEFGARSIIDVGCGDGVAVKFFNSLIDPACYRFAIGIEGIKQSGWPIYQHDYTTGVWIPKSTFEENVDLIWCCEFVEHVEEQYVDNFLDTFSRAKIVLMTHAEPGQAGYHHVNLKSAHYWVEKLKNIGYNLDTNLTILTRELAGLNTNPWNHYKRSGLAFVRR